MIYSKYLRNKLVDFLLRGGSFTPPVTTYLALLTAKPDINDGYDEIGQTTANGYTRMAITSDATNWAATNGAGLTTNPSTGTTMQTSNNAAIVFPNPSGGNWYNGGGSAASPITYLALFDSATIGAGNLLFYAPCGAAKTVASTEFNPTISGGALVLTLDS